MAPKAPGQQVAVATQNPRPVNMHPRNPNLQPLGKNLVFALQEAQDGAEGTLHISSFTARVLFNIGAARSFISQKFVHKLSLGVEQLA